MATKKTAKVVKKKLTKKQTEKTVNKVITKKPAVKKPKVPKAPKAPVKPRVPRKPKPSFDSDLTDKTVRGATVEEKVEIEQALTGFTSQELVDALTPEASHFSDGLVYRTDGTASVWSDEWGSGSPPSIDEVKGSQGTEISTLPGSGVWARFKWWLSGLWIRSKKWLLS